METNRKQQVQQLFMALLNSFNTGVDDVVRLFTEDAVIEYPYAPSIGTPARLTKEEYHRYLAGALPQMPNLVYSEVRVYLLQQPDAYWAEVHAETTIPATNVLYQQDYVMHFTLRDGLFSFYREYWNPIPALKAFGGDGAAQDVFTISQ